jgi:hypothetical protein
MWEGVEGGNRSGEKLYGGVTGGRGYGQGYCRGHGEGFTGMRYEKVL